MSEWVHRTVLRVKIVGNVQENLGFLKQYLIHANDYTSPTDLEMILVYCDAGGIKRYIEEDFKERCDHWHLGEFSYQINMVGDEIFLDCPIFDGWRDFKIIENFSKDMANYIERYGSKTSGNVRLYTYLWNTKSKESEAWKW